MKSSILLLALATAAFTSCTTAYKTGQTPDDVYFSPTRDQDEYVVVEKNDDRSYQGANDYYDDRYLRMRVSNRYRWSELDDWYYYGSRYNYSYYPQTGLYYNPWTPNTYWNAHYNPYYGGGFYGGGGIIIKPTSTVYNRPRTVNLNTYNNSMLTNSNYSNSKTGANDRRNIYNNANSAGSRNGNSNYNYNSNSSRSSNGSSLRNIFGSGNNNNSSSNSTNSSNSSSRPAATPSSSSSSSGSSGNAPVRKF